MILILQLSFISRDWPKMNQSMALPLLIQFFRLTFPIHGTDFLPMPQVEGQAKGVLVEIIVSET